MRAAKATGAESLRFRYGFDVPHGSVNLIADGIESTPTV
jgi:hypothetical protein